MLVRCDALTMGAKLACLLLLAGLAFTGTASINDTFLIAQHGSNDTWYPDVQPLKRLHDLEPVD